MYVTSHAQLPQQQLYQLSLAPLPDLELLRLLNAALAEQREDEPSGGGASMQDAVFGMQDAVMHQRDSSGDGWTAHA